jgi:acyl-CoA synthetase (AMP-forming)/AMP-acid ligase II
MTAAPTPARHAEGPHLSALLEARASEFGSKSVFRFLDSGADWSFTDLERRARRVARQLGAVAPGERVGILAEDRATFCDAFFGAHARGAVPVPLGVAGTVGSHAWRRVLRDRVDRFRLGAVLTDPGGADDLTAALDPTPVVGVDGERGDPAAHMEAAPHAFVQPSSGTTGDPKGVVVGHAALLANLAAIGAHWSLGPDDIGLSWLPLFHDMGLIGTTINALFQGGTLYQWPTAGFLRSPGRFFQLVGELGVTMTVAPPFALQLVTRRQQRRGSAVDLSGVRSILVGAELIRPEVLDAFAATFADCGLDAAALTPTYGLAEATLGVTAMPAAEPYRIAALTPHPAVSCGVPLPGVAVRCTDDGEVLVRSASLMEGYLDDAAATAATIVDGWLHTGDTGVLDGGELVVLGRTKEMINRGGVRLPASDFELALAGVDGLLPDRVVAFADTDAGAERVVVLAESRWTDRAGEAVLAARARLAEAGLPADVVELVRPGFIPRTTSGKLRRAAARDAWRAEPARASVSDRAVSTDE